MPDPLATAAPRPTTTAPAPNHLYGSTRGRPRWRPLPLGLVAFTERRALCRPATAAPK
jgi:hypothetical protein